MDNTGSSDDETLCPNTPTMMLVDEPDSSREAENKHNVIINYQLNVTC